MTNLSLGQIAARIEPVLFRQTPGEEPVSILPAKYDPHDVAFDAARVIMEMPEAREDERVLAVLVAAGHLSEEKVAQARTLVQGLAWGG